MDDRDARIAALQASLRLGAETIEALAVSVSVLTDGSEPYIEIARRSVDIATAMRVLAGAEDGPQHRRFADALATIWN